MANCFGSQSKAQLAAQQNLILQCGMQEWRHASWLARLESLLAIVLLRFSSRPAPGKCAVIAEIAHQTPSQQEPMIPAMSQLALSKEIAASAVFAIHRLCWPTMIQFGSPGCFRYKMSYNIDAVAIKTRYRCPTRMRRTDSDDSDTNENRFVKNRK